MANLVLLIGLTRTSPGIWNELTTGPRLVTASVAGRLTNRDAKSLDKSQMAKVSDNNGKRRCGDGVKRLKGLTFIN
jgi:hypothetical protein